MHVRFWPNSVIPRAKSHPPRHHGGLLHLVDRGLGDCTGASAELPDPVEDAFELTRGCDAKGSICVHDGEPDSELYEIKGFAGFS